MTAKLQGQDEILVEAPVERLWPLIADSTLLAEWGPPVRAVQIFRQSDQGEGSALVVVSKQNLMGRGATMLNDEPNISRAGRLRTSLRRRASASFES